MERCSALRDSANESKFRAEQLADDYFRRHLDTISLDQLAEFPGIGPATLDRLRQAGCRQLAHVTTVSVERIPGIGRARAKDLGAAVKNLVGAARSRFDAGACPEAQEYRHQVSQLHADERAQAHMREQKLAALDVALQETRALADMARPVTFWAYVVNQDIPDLTASVLSRPLPEPRVVSPIPVDPFVRSTPPRPPAITPPTGALAANTAFEPMVLPRATPANPVVATSPSADLFQAALQSPTGGAAATPSDEHPWLPKLRVAAGFAFVVAKADGRVAAAERATIRAYLGAKFGHDVGLARHIDPLMERTEAATPDEAAVIIEVCRLMTAAEQAELYALAEQIADASGRRNPREEAMLSRIAAAFNIAVVDSRPQLQPPRSQAPAPDNDPRTVLEIPADVDLDVALIRRRYALLIEKLDPSKAASLGPEFQRLANEKRSRLRAAAEALLAPFQVPLDAPTAPTPPHDLRHNPDLDDVFGV
jgi:uncharacterized tellurite resistance protein B-like protein